MRQVLSLSSHERSLPVRVSYCVYPFGPHEGSNRLEIPQERNSYPLHDGKSGVFRTGTKYVYLFPVEETGSLFKHFHIYARWPTLARERGVDVSMVGFLPIIEYIWRYRQVRKRTRSQVCVIPTPLGGKVKSACIVLYFILLALLYDRIVIHGRKASVDTRLELARRVVGADRIRYIIELESDAVAEAEYAATQNGESVFYESTSPSQAEAKQRRAVSRSDHVITITKELRDILIERYPEFDLETKTSAITVDFPEKVEYSGEVRREVRASLGLTHHFVYTYIGSAAPVWQNVDRTIEIFSLLSGQMEFKPFLLLLVRAPDQAYVEKIIRDVGLSADEYLLMEVPPEKVKSYLYASDIGVMLRDDHPMCEVVYGHKYLEYLSAGLPVLTTEVAQWSSEVSDNDYGIVLEDIGDDEEILSALRAYREVDVDRELIVRWACQKFDPEPQVDRYIEILESLSEDGRLDHSEPAVETGPG